MSKVIYKYNPNDLIDDAILKYITCVVLAIKFNLEYEYEDIIQEIEEFKYIKGFDHFCDDCGSMYGSTFHKLREHAELSDDILGFNTLGFFKSRIDLDKLVSTDWINPSNGHGLFVKNVTKINKNNFNSVFNEKIKFYNLKVVEQSDDLVSYLIDKDKLIEYIEANKFNHYVRIKNQDKIKINDIIEDIKLVIKNMLKI